MKANVELLKKKIQQQTEHEKSFDRGPSGLIASGTLVAFFILGAGKNPLEWMIEGQCVLQATNVLGEFRFRAPHDLDDLIDELRIFLRS